MTEDDTFNALRKSTYEVVLNEWMMCAGLRPNDLETTINKHGWTYDEFWTEWDKA
jgi:hypothetical protein